MKYNVHLIMMMHSPFPKNMVGVVGVVGTVGAVWLMLVVSGSKNNELSHGVEKSGRSVCLSPVLPPMM